jgi:hypothetical protein
MVDLQDDSSLPAVEQSRTVMETPAVCCEVNGCIVVAMADDLDALKVALQTCDLPRGTSAAGEEPDSFCISEEKGLRPRMTQMRR